MYKVVIVDDEPIIVDGLSRIIQWDKYGCRLVGTAFDGRKGIEVIDETQPDIVFSAVREKHPDMMVTILSGVRSFECVQTAIKLGVCRFLLKPSRSEDLEEALQYMTETLTRRKARNDYIKYCLEKGISFQNRKIDRSHGATGSFLVKNALEYLDMHYAEKITLSDLADKMYVSQWHLSKLLNGYTKKSFNELLNEARIREAQWLLTDFSLRVSDIAEMVGFVDIAHFSRVFKKYTGMSANEYRNRKLS